MLKLLDQKGHWIACLAAVTYSQHLSEDIYLVGVRAADEIDVSAFV